MPAPAFVRPAGIAGQELANMPETTRVELGSTLNVIALLRPEELARSNAAAVPPVETNAEVPPPVTLTPPFSSNDP